MIVVCYKTNTPIIYNKGTKYESKCDTFLAYYSHKNREEVEKEVERLNTEKPFRLWNGQLAHCNDRTYFVSEQEEM